MNEVNEELIYDKLDECLINCVDGKNVINSISWIYLIYKVIIGK